MGSFLLIHSRGSGRLTCPRSQLVGQCGDLKFPSIDFVSRQLLFRGRGAGTEPEGGGGESSTPPSPASALALAGPSRPAQRKRLSAARRCQREASSLAEPRWRFCYSKAPGGERGWVSTPNGIPRCWAQPRTIPVQLTCSHFPLSPMAVVSRANHHGVVCVPALPTG